MRVSDYETIAIVLTCTCRGPLIPSPSPPQRGRAVPRVLLCCGSFAFSVLVLVPVLVLVLVLSEAVLVIGGGGDERWKEPVVAIHAGYSST